MEGPSGEPWLFSKECFSNGCIGTVDVMYPASPMFMLLSNRLLKGTVIPVLEYAGSPRLEIPALPRTTWAPIRWPTVRCMEAGKLVRKAKCPWKSAETF